MKYQLIINNFSVPKEVKKMKKTELTADCRVKINSLSEAKIQLINLQKQMLEEEMNLKRTEYETKIIIMKEEHKWNIEKQKCELEILKKKLEKE